jgi:hypothetical protein
VGAEAASLKEAAMPPFYVVASVAFEVTADSASDALEAVRAGTAGPYEARAAAAYPHQRAYENADKVSHSSRRDWVKRARRG